jgi:hypothetical protein
MYKLSTYLPKSPSFSPARTDLAVKLLRGVPFIMNIEIAPVSVMACVAVIVIALAHSKHCNGVEQFDAMTVASLFSIESSAAKGSKRPYSMG